MNHFYKIFTIMIMFLVLVAVPTMAGQGAGQNKEGAGMYQNTVTGKYKYFDSHPGQPSQWVLVNPDVETQLPENNYNGSGNYKIDATTFGFGVDGDSRLIHGGFALGTSAAGGIATGNGQGGVVFSGNAEGNMDVLAGGFTQTSDFDGGGYSGTQSVGIGQVGVSGDVATSGLGFSNVNAFGAAFQKTDDMSLVLGNGGLTYGKAEQGSVGFVAGSASGALGGSAEFEGSINMVGNTYSGSLKETSTDGGFTTKSLGTVVGAFTNVESIGEYSSNGVSGSYVDGGYSVNGGVTTQTSQVAPNGFTTAGGSGAYSGSGSLGTSFSGSAVGYSVTNMTTLSGFNGGVNQASVGMNVTVNQNNQIDQ